MDALLFLSSEVYLSFFFCWGKFGRSRYTHQIFRDQNFTIFTFTDSYQALAKRNRKSSQVFNLRWTCILPRNPLAWTCVYLKLIRTQGYASFSPFGHPTQIGTSWLQVVCICMKFTARLAWTCESIWTPFASPYISLGFVNLRQMTRESDLD